MEKYVVSLEIAKELKEIGIDQKSEFYWACSEENYGKPLRYVLITKIMENKHHEYYNANKYFLYSAFTVGELGELLPDDCYTYRHGLKPDRRFWFCSIRGTQLMVSADTEANTRAQLLIYLEMGRDK